MNLLFFRLNLTTALCLLFSLFTGCAVNKTAPDTVVLSGKVEKVYDPCTQSLLGPGANAIDKPPGVALLENAMKPALDNIGKSLDKAFAARECLYLIRQEDSSQIFFRTDKQFQ